MCFKKWAKVRFEIKDWVYNILRIRSISYYPFYSLFLFNIFERTLSDWKLSVLLVIGLVAMTKGATTRGIKNAPRFRFPALKEGGIRYPLNFKNAFLSKVKINSRRNVDRARACISFFSWKLSFYSRKTLSPI